MKTLLATLALTLSASAFSAKVPSAAFTETYIKKNSNVTDTGVNYTTNRTLQSWCTGMASPVAFGTYEVAEKFDSMTDGLYRCDGKFAQVPNERQNPITIFAINGCSEVNPAELKSECPPIK
ncbi:hypothetical protein SHI21_06065 [Bacteriovorax sp. PP10]|uniref:Uncharacterized protein n=1 Tax=Bacteriovorax antarcticus TaxID=3088717 RepID=A0ABU5VTR3_9BACT|nr:hypothetical protein [Bacteriovorax sp. PP10]MEA9355754.1 hypothetical protein [Bacteriovorax sp. PP10]